MDPGRIIRDKIRAIEHAEGEFRRAAMREYFDTVYYPAKQAVRDECAALGHGPLAHHSMLIGWSENCQWCGAGVKRFDETGQPWPSE